MNNSLSEPKKRPALHFAFFVWLAFCIYATWHLAIGSWLGGFLPSTPGELPKDDPVLSLHEAFSISFLLGFLAVFLVAMLVNASLLLYQEVRALPRPGKWIYAINGVMGFTVDVLVIIYLQQQHGPWKNYFWRDLETHWQAVSSTTAIIAMAGTVAALLITYSFFKPDRAAGQFLAHKAKAKDWRRRLLFDILWLFVLVGVVFLLGHSTAVYEQASSILGRDIAWTLVAIVLLAFLLLQSLPYWLITRKCFPQKKRTNAAVAFLMPFLCLFVLLTIELTLFAANAWRLR